MPASMPNESVTVCLADSMDMTSAQVTLLSSGVDGGSIADAVSLDDDG